MLVATICALSLTVLGLVVVAHNQSAQRAWAEISRSEIQATAAEFRTENMRLRTILHLHGVDPDTGRSREEWTP